MSMKVLLKESFTLKDTKAMEGIIGLYSWVGQGKIDILWRHQWNSDKFLKCRPSCLVWNFVMNYT